MLAVSPVRSSSLAHVSVTHSGSRTCGGGGKKSAGLRKARDAASGEKQDDDGRASGT